MKTRARQREFGFTNWGGKRRGAGRKPRGQRAGVSHARRPRLCARHPVLVTMRLRAGLPSLRYREAHELLRRSMAASSAREGLQVVEYSVQSNHVHLLVESRSETALSRGMNGLAVRIVRGLNRLWRRAGRVFADRYHARILSTPRAVRTALVYVLQNARKHGAWIARRADEYSSGPSFEGWNGRTIAQGRAGTEEKGALGEPARNARESAPSRDADSSPGWLARARTWLLSVGWKRHGLIDPEEVPCAG